MEITVTPCILVFLPPTAARVIAEKLGENGYLSITACTVDDLQRVLRSAAVNLVIATRPDIDVVRKIRPLPVINLEIFFHFDLQANSAEVGTKRFDTLAFLTRVRTLAAPSSHRSRAAA